MAYEIGVDVSKWQAPEKIDWRKLRDEAGVRYMIGRYAYGNLIDTTFWRHGWRAMRAGGISIGAYQYLVPNQDSLQQATLALAIARELTIPFVVDIEARGLTAQQVDVWLSAFARADVPCMIYTSYSAWRASYGIGPHKWSHIPLWIANYTDRPSPMLADGWTRYAYWQHSQNGRLSGYNGAIDLNRKPVG